MVRKGILAAVTAVMLIGFSLTGMGRRTLDRTVAMYRDMQVQRAVKLDKVRMENTFGFNYKVPEFVKDILAEHPSPLLVLPPRHYVWENGDTRELKPDSYMWPEPLTWSYFFGPMPVISHHHPRASQATHAILFDQQTHDLKVVVFVNDIHRQQVLSMFDSVERRYKVGKYQPKPR